MTGTFRLIPQSGARAAHTGEPFDFVADGIEPWLSVVGLDCDALAGSFVEWTYRASLLDEPARPVFRFTRADGANEERIGPAPIVGAAIWVGRVPAGTVEISISPTNRPGPFGFVIERLRQRTWPSLLLEGFARRPRQTRSAILTRLIGWAPESDNNLAWAIGATEMSRFPEWAAPRRRACEPAGLDRPRHDWSRSAEIAVVVRGASDEAATARTLASLRTQAFPNWSALLVDAPAGTHDDPRIETVDCLGATDRIGSMPDDALVAVLDAGDALTPFACAALAELRHRHPEARLVYGDEAAAGVPVLTPGWSPRLLRSRPYLGRACFVAGTAGWTPDERRAFIAERTLPDSLTTASSDVVRPLRRVLVETPGVAPPPRRPAPSMPPGLGAATAAIVILTRNQPALLARAVASVRARSAAGTYRLVIVDNGDAAGPAGDLLADLAEAPDVVVLRRPEAFDFSRFCNDAVVACHDELLVFLNDDTEVRSDDWLGRLAALAFDPGVGAVGAKLTFPDGRLQHVGVLVGMGGSAGHFGSFAPDDDPGWAGRNVVAHEVSAVTGACLAVARTKFEAVGGFDAEHLPVELSDIDLCLKLNARGWQTMIDPAVHLMHEESASRGGATFRRLDVYGRQREVFVERWRHVLRDDPAFHPGLSLYSLSAALG